MTCADLCFLCKEQVIKGLYLAIGSKHNVPKSLLLIIYRLTKDDSEVRQYHTNEIYRNTIPNFSITSLYATGTGSAVYTNDVVGDVSLECAIKWEKKNVFGSFPLIKVKNVRHDCLADAVLLAAVKNERLHTIHCNPFALLLKRILV